MSTKKVFKIQEVMTMYKYCIQHLERSELWINKVKYKISPILRLLDVKGFKCDVCGIKGTHFEAYTSNGGKHLRLCTQIKNNFITIDHTVPQCIGGNNTLENQQPLCSHCNSIWKSKIDSELRRLVIGRACDKKDNSYLLIIGEVDDV